MKCSRGGVAAKTRQAIEKVITELGYVLWDVTFAKEGADYILSVRIDRESGISLDDCSAVTRAIDPIIDEADPVDCPYILEVASAGIERVLRTEEHYGRAVERGWQVNVKLFAAQDGRKEITGRLVSRDGESLTVEEPGASLKIELKNISRVSADVPAGDA